MSELTTRNATENMLTADTIRQATFVGDNQFEKGTLLNATAGELTYEIGTLLGRVATTNRLVPCASGATDGSQYPVGVLAQEVTLAASGTASVMFCVGGQVNTSAIIFDGTDALTTVVSAKTLGDRIKSDTLGVVLVTVTEGTFTDN